MIVIFLFAAIIAPAVFWISYFYYKDRFRPEPVTRLIEAYLLGVLAGFLCWAFYEIQPSFGIPANFMTVLAQGSKLDLVLYSIGGVGLVEEAFKMLPFLVLVRRFKAFNEKIDGIIYASVLAVGFASFENLGFLPTMKGWALVGRAFASPLTHTVFASIWGYLIGKAVIKKQPLLPAALRGLFLAALVHGLYNVLTINPVLRVLSALLILAVWIWQIRTLEMEARKEKEAAAPQPPA